MKYITRELEKVVKELIKVFGLLDRASVPRSKGAVICMKPGLGAIDRDNYIDRKSVV